MGLLSDLSKSQLLAWAKDPARTGEELAEAVGRFPEVDRAIASHPNASSALLSTLSHSSDKATRARVAANPGTPAADLVRLGQQFPKEFLANPALDLLLLENPALLGDAPVSLLVQILRSEACPDVFLVWAADHPEEKVQLAVAMNAAAPPQALDALGRSAYTKVRQGALARVFGAYQTIDDPEVAFRAEVLKRLRSMKLSELREAWQAKDIGLPQWPALPLFFRLELARALWELAKCSYPPVMERLMEGADGDLREDLAMSRSLPLVALLARLQDPDDRVRRVLVWHPSTPAHALEALSRDPDIEVRTRVAQNPNTPPHALEVLSEELGYEVARNPSTPANVLGALAKHPEAWVRQGVASNLGSPAQLLEALSKDLESGVRAGVAANSSTPSKSLEALAKDLESGVRAGVAANSSTPSKSLEALAKDSELDVRQAVAKNPGTPPEVLLALSRDRKPVRLALLRNPSTPHDVLVAISNDSDQTVREELANSPNTPPQLLRAEPDGKDSGFRWNVARNPQTLPEVLATLSKSPDEYTRQKVAENSNTPPNVLQALSQDREAGVRREVARNPATPSDALAALVNCQDDWVKETLAGNPSTPPGALQSLSREKKAVRLAVARNPSAPNAVLQKLAASGDIEICERVVVHEGAADGLLASMAVPNQHERILASVLLNPAIPADLADRVAGLLFDDGNPFASQHYRLLLSKATSGIRSACEKGDVLHFCGRDPNRSVLSKRPLAALMALCAGPFIEPSRIARLSGSTDWLVRAAVARNPGTPEALLQKLCADVHPLVSALGKMRLGGTSAQAFADVKAVSPSTLGLSRAVSAVFERLRQDAKLSCIFTDRCWTDHASVADLLQSLGEFDEKGVLTSCALDQVLTDLNERERDLLWGAFAEAPSDVLRGAMAEHADCPVSIIRRLAKDKSAQVLEVVIRRLPAEESATVIKRIAARSGWGIEKLSAITRSADLLKALAVSKSRSVRDGVAGNRHTPPEVLEALSIDPEVKETVARNPDLPWNLQTI